MFSSYEYDPEYYSSANHWLSQIGMMFSLNGSLDRWQTPLANERTTPPLQVQLRDQANMEAYRRVSNGLYRLSAIMDTMRDEIDQSNVAASQ
jgi:hypothetical protein